MPLDLTDDRRYRVGGQLDTAVELEPVDGLDQADGADLNQVVELLAASRIAARERTHEGQMELDEPLTRSGVAVPVVGAQEGMHVRVTGGHGPPCRCERNVLLETNPIRAVAPLDSDRVDDGCEEDLQRQLGLLAPLLEILHDPFDGEGPDEDADLGTAIEISIVTRSAAR